MLRNLELDHTGFREALLVDGPSTAAPLVQASGWALAGGQPCHMLSA